MLVLSYPNPKVSSVIDPVHRLKTTTNEALTLIEGVAHSKRADLVVHDHLFMSFERSLSHRARRALKGLGLTVKPNAVFYAHPIHEVIYRLQSKVASKIKHENFVELHVDPDTYLVSINTGTKIVEVGPLEAFS